MKLTNAMMAVALGTGAMLLGGCASVHETNMDSCVRVDSVGPKPDLIPLLKWLIPGYNHTRPSTPCLHSQYFMGLVGMAQVKGNENNWRMNKLVVDAYDTLKASVSKDKYAATALRMIDQRLEGQGLEIADFRNRFEANKPRVVGQAQEGNCWNYKTLENGKPYDDRVCVTVNMNMPNP